MNFPNLRMKSNSLNNIKLFNKINFKNKVNKIKIKNKTDEMIDYFN